MEIDDFEAVVNVLQITDPEEAVTESIERRCREAFGVSNVQRSRKRRDRVRSAATVAPPWMPQSARREASY